MPPSRFWIAAVFTILPAFAQDEARQIWDDYFGSSRPPSQTGAEHKPQAKPVYKSVHSGQVGSGARQQQHGSKTVALGVTVWKLEPSAARDGARLLVQEPQGAPPVQLTPHRLEANDQLKPGDHVRLSIEAPGSGYLYVVDQELYAGGRVGPPYLIFPTKRTRGGDNSARPGQLVEIPSQDDVPNVFTIRPGAPGERGEKLTIVFAPQPIAGVPVTEHAQELPAAMFEHWVASWGNGSQQFELSGGRGRAWTPVEKKAGENARLLTQDDPPPQTVFVMPAAKDEPVAASLRLEVQ